MSDDNRTDGKPHHPANSWFPKQARFWEARASMPVNQIFSSPEHLWQCCVEYFRWVEDNPLYAPETVKYMGQATLTAVPKMRIMTVTGLTLFLGTTNKTWYNYRDRPGFDVICEQVEEIMKNQKLTGAANDLLNANIISRLLGLVDKQNIESQQNIQGNMKWQIEIVDPAVDEESSDG